MKNYEKYAEKIREYEGDSICTDFVEPYILKSINAKCTNISCVKCHLYRTIWLMEEYEEPKVDWSKVKVDTPILVRQGKTGDWLERHFAKYENGNVYAWVDGQTSWTGADEIKWKYAKLAKVDWNKVEVDTPILVRDDEDGKWIKRYFAKYKDGKVYAWNGGRTGQIESRMTPWNFAKLAENEETK